MSSNLNIISELEEEEKQLPSNEYALGKGLLQPFNSTNSGSRKIMQIIQKEQAMQLQKSETAIVMTGYENQFGELSSSFIRADETYVVLNRIAKYNMSSEISKSNYWLILLNSETGMIHTVQRISYKHITESYGYNLDTSYLDSLDEGDVIPKGTPIVKANSFDSANNKCDGVNLTTIYMATALTTEDPIVLSESAANKFKAPLFNKTQIVVNDNDILLNLYGDTEHYKTFPDIGEDISKGILCGVRRERKDDEALYSQSVEHLKELMISDEKYIGSGKVIDINIYCNNPEKLDSVMYNNQVAKYYYEYLEFCKAVVETITPLLNTGLKMTYDAQRLYYNCKDVIEGKAYIKDKVFNNIIMEIVTMQEQPLRTGDKITDRYGGKGVVSAILPDELMPKYQQFNKWTPVDAIYNSSTIINRENPGQSFETEITYIGCKIIEYIANWWWRYRNEMDELYESFQENAEFGSLNEYEDMIYRYLKCLSENEAKAYFDNIMKADTYTRYSMMDSIISDGAIYVVMKPISESMSIDKLAKLYKEFPWIDANEILVPQQGSNGQYRFIKARRKLITGKKYIYRLKQFAEEKHSAVSLASTNIRSENTKSKANKLHKSAHATTPVKFGEMEFEDLVHMNVEIVIQVLMMLSSSPSARRLNQQLLVGDPFDIDVKLDTDSKSRSVEIVNAYLKTMGLRLVFQKIPKDKSFGAKRMVAVKVPGLKVPIKAISRVPEYLTKDIINDLVDDKFKKDTKDFEKECKKNKVIPVIKRIPTADSRNDEIWNIVSKAEKSNNLKELKKNLSTNIQEKKDVIEHIVAEKIPGGTKC